MLQTDDPVARERALKCWWQLKRGLSEGDFEMLCSKLTPESLPGLEAAAIDELVRLVSDSVPFEWALGFVEIA